eukprot:Seg255.6 transcript_id=Seg255.6/GoldUCD/mRNA.D3Y31 product="Protein mom-5" protein_id=Seg255.6/GoldUCD/D3Y31
MTFYSILAILLTSTTLFSNGLNSLSMNTKCEDLQESMCSGLAYNQTFFPNILNHLSQYEASRFFTQFHPLIKIGCYEDIKLFLCSLFFPVCTSVDKPIPPCRSFCKKARRGCRPVMRRHGFEWPEIFRCTKFPKRSGGKLCLERPRGGEKKKKNRG